MFTYSIWQDKKKINLKLVSVRLKHLLTLKNDMSLYYVQCSSF